MLARNEPDARALPPDWCSVKNQNLRTISMTTFSPHHGAARHFAAATVVALAFVQASSAEIAVRSGEKIAFLGDSITEGGWGNPLGYVRLVMAGLEANGIKAEAVPAGISGHKSDNMLARLERD